jgi:dihydroorotate dehydrogenase (NAD+) catalytic subunit
VNLFPDDVLSLSLLSSRKIAVTIASQTQTVQTLPRYDLAKSYRWNYDHAPEPTAIEIPPVDGDWTFCGLQAASPLGMPAGPLLNGKWILYYASLGFDVLTYKTVRSGFRECYELPNLVPVKTGPLNGSEERLSESPSMNGSWAVSFGMPSMLPDEWRRDVEWTRENLSVEKLLSVSVVGTVQAGWSIADLAEDYAQCVRWAVDSGADAVEMNFSCPNVATCDGQLFQQPDDASTVAQAAREAAGSKPVIVKIGHVTDRDSAIALLDALSESVDAIAMTNSVAATIESSGELLFDGQKRGICGAATREASTTQTRLFAELIRERGETTRLIGVGGASNQGDVRAYLDAGAECVHIATAAMVDPLTGIRIRQGLAQ